MAANACRGIRGWGRLNFPAPLGSQRVQKKAIEENRIPEYNRIRNRQRKVNHLGVKDTATIQYMKQNEIFADAFNFFVYGGRQVIDPNSLVELDTREIGVPYGGEAGAEQPVQRTRDIAKSVTAMTDRRNAYLVLAIENQANIHYAMPVKDMVSDALQYAKQVEKAVASHKTSGDYKSVGSDEYLSGFLKEDRLMPVVTLVIYFDVKDWDGPMSLHEMFRDTDDAILALVPDYKINLIAPAAIPDADFDKFSTTLKEVLAFIKYSKDADKMAEVLASDQGYRHLGRKEVDVLNSCVNANLVMQDNEEVLDVCDAIQTMERRAADKATRETRISTLLDVVKNLMHVQNESADQIMDKIGVSDTDRKELKRCL